MILYTLFDTTYTSHTGARTPIYNNPDKKTGFSIFERLYFLNKITKICQRISLSLSLSKFS